MASQEGILTKRLECPTCYDLMTEPKLLSCSHTFCERCVIQFYHSNASKGVISCPLCSKLTKLKNGDSSNLQTNYLVKGMVEDICSANPLCAVCNEKSLAHMYCQSCNLYLCEQCLEDHGRKRGNANHELFSLDDIKKGKVAKLNRFCQKHDQEKKRWVCRTCDTSICRACRVLDHSEPNHDIVEISEIQKYHQQKIDSLLNIVEIKNATIARHKDIIKEQDTNIEEKVAQLTSDIDTSYKAIIRRLTMSRDEENANFDEREKGYNAAINRMVRNINILTNKRARNIEECDKSIKQVTKRKNELTEKCHKYESNLKAELSQCTDGVDKKVDIIRSKSDLVSNSIKTTLVGEALKVHNALRSDLEVILEEEDPDDSVPLAIVSEVKHMKFDTYQTCDKHDKQRMLMIGNMCGGTTWALEHVSTYKLAGTKAWDIQALQDGKMAIGCCGGGIEMVTIDLMSERMLNDIEIRRMCLLSNGSFVITDANHSVVIYTHDRLRSPVTFSTNLTGKSAGLCVDKHDNIYVGNYGTKKISVFRPEGGSSTREIDCGGISPFYIRHMNHSNHMVVNDDKCTVNVIDEEGTVVHRVPPKEGYTPSIAVMQDDSVLIGWRRDKYFTIKLYNNSPKLKFVRTVLKNFTIEPQIYCLAEFLTGEIAFPDNKNLYVFCKSVPEFANV